MEQLSLIDKFKVLFDNILEHPLFIILFFIPVVVILLQKKHGNKVLVIVYFLIILAILLSFGDVIFKLFDNVMDGLFMVLYFPNFVTLFIVVILSSVIALVTLFSKKMSKVNKAINYTSFGVIQMLFVLILIVVRVNKINIYTDNALYTNDDILSLMQLLIGAFALQVIALIIIWGINKLTSNLDSKDPSVAASINAQIANLKNTKIKTLNINNNKIGYINVANQMITSTPKLKPFKFDVNKLESIDLVGEVKEKILKPKSLDNREVTYLNEIVKVRKLKPIRLDSVKIDSIYLNGKTSDPKLFNKLTLNNKEARYLNEVVKEKKVKPAHINYEAPIVLNYPEEPKLFNKIGLKDKVTTYLNEVVKTRKLKPVKLDSNKIESINLNGKLGKPKLIKKINLANKETSYLNEIIKDKKIKPVRVDSNKIYSIELEKNKKYNKVDLDLTKPIFDNTYAAEFDKILNVKPDLLKPMAPITHKYVAEKIPRIEATDIVKEPTPSVDLIKNLNIIDMQSTLDTVVKYKLMKNVRLKGVEKSLAIDNLKVLNYEGLVKVLSLSKLNK